MPLPVVNADEQVDTVVLEHLDWTPTCEDRFPTGPCENEATYVAKCRSCRCSWLVCTFHVEHYRSLKVNRVQRLFCGYCHAAASSLDGLVEITPLDGAV